VSGVEKIQLYAFLNSAEDGCGQLQTPAALFLVKGPLLSIEYVASKDQEAVFWEEKYFGL
jgi:hypothetical protein